MKSQKLILLFLFAILLTTCKKEKLTVDQGDPDCLTYPEVSVGGVGIGFKGYQIYTNYTQYLNPVFNPLNENEFIFTRVYRDTEYTLMKHNLLTGKSEVLAENVRTDELVAFTQDGRIVYVMDKNHLGIMNSDGSDKQVFLEFGLGLSSFAFDKNMERIIMSDVHTGEPLVTVMHQLDGMRSDTFYYDLDSLKDRIMFNQGDWSLKDSLATLFIDKDFYGVAVVNFEKNTLHQIFKVSHSDNDRVFNVKWHPDNQTVFFVNKNDGIYRYTAGELKLVKSHCDNRIYSRLSISLSGDKILVGRINRIKVSDTRLHTDHCIYIMNTDGSEEVMLNLD